MIQLRFSIFILGVFLFTGCRKDVPAGELIQANGFVIDSVLNKRLPNAVVYLYGANSTFYGVYYDIGPLDSTISDNNGNFSIKYTTQGNSVDYALAVGNSIYRGFTNQTNYVVDYTHAIYIFNYLHQLNNVALKARELYYARVNLKVLSNPYDTLFFDASGVDGEFYLQNLFIGKTIDTSFLTRYLPGDNNVFTYDILATSLEDSGFIREETDTLSSQFQDTIIVSKTINSTYNLPLKLW